MSVYNRKDVGGIFSALPALKESTVIALQSVSRFKGTLAITLEIIRSLVLGFLVVPNNILYVLDHTHGNTYRFQHVQSNQDTENGGVEGAGYGKVYIRSGICLVVLGCISLVVCLVFSYFASASKWKLARKQGLSKSMTDSKSTVIVSLCLVIGNMELIMSVIAGCMELLYRPLVHSLNRWHNMELAIGIMNILVVIAHYCGSLMIIKSILGNKNELEETELSSHATHYPQGQSHQQYQSGGYSSYHNPTFSGIQHRSDSSMTLTPRQY